MNPIFLDQYHIDIVYDNKVTITKAELALISQAFKDVQWLETFILNQFPAKLQKKIEIKITR